jgi:hypothetical protein
VTHCSKSAVGDLLRIAWRTVGSIVCRVVADAEANTDRFAGLRRIGIDEISYKRGHKYLTVVVDHETGVLLGPTPAGTRRHWRGSSTISVNNAAPRSPLGERRCGRVDRGRRCRTVQERRTVPGPVPSPRGWTSRRIGLSRESTPLRRAS